MKFLVELSNGTLGCLYEVPGGIIIIKEFLEDKLDKILEQFLDFFSQTCFKITSNSPRNFFKDSSIELHGFLQKTVRAFFFRVIICFQRLLQNIKSSEFL